MFFVYIMTNRWRSTLYIRVTSDLSKRVSEHQSPVLEGFTRRYNLDRLIHVEECTDVRLAIAREKQLKGWTRRKKECLINQTNPLWNDLSKVVATFKEPSLRSE